MMKIIRLVLTLIIIISYDCQAQDCNTIYEVNAGPDIDVCEGGSVNLNGIIGGEARTVVWLGGKGTFTPGRNILNPEYTPSEDETGTIVTLTLQASNPKFKCPAVESQIKLTVNNQARANAGENQTICMGDLMRTNGKVIGRAKKVTWTSYGSGKFVDANRLDAVYIPSDKDILDGLCTLQLLVEPFGFCMPDSSSLVVTFNKEADFATPLNKFVNPGTEVKLVVKTTSNGTAKWETEGTGIFINTKGNETTYTPSAEDVQNGTVNVTVTLAGKSGKCSLKKKVKIHLKGK